MEVTDTFWEEIAEREKGYPKAKAVRWKTIGMLTRTAEFPGNPKPFRAESERGVSRTTMVSSGGSGVSRASILKVNSGHLAIEDNIRNRAPVGEETGALGTMPYMLERKVNSRNRPLYGQQDHCV